MDPLTPLAISAAAQSIKPLARGVSQVTEFASVLASEMAGGLGAQEEAVAPPTANQIEALQQEASEIVDRLFRNSDLTVNSPLRINVQADGKLRLAGDHPQAGQIESLLNGDEGLRSLTAQLNSNEHAEIQLVWPPARPIPT